ncbi:unnamed protein product [Spirodela intermedia]|uniref:Uncharacterized protein n=1 Tax=Spirodela intermedia TaxID=51605 RepID=A0A7I8IZ66_SPIIN|nr:unnamed protein product [Spirodela intermedia]CAA6663168.1 unnamed protein product [Spirodela intermedia]
MGDPSELCDLRGRRSGQKNPRKQPNPRIFVISAAAGPAGSAPPEKRKTVVAASRRRHPPSPRTASRGRRRGVGGRRRPAAAPTILQISPLTRAPTRLSGSSGSFRDRSFNIFLSIFDITPHGSLFFITFPLDDRIDALKVKKTENYRRRDKTYLGEDASSSQNSRHGRRQVCCKLHFHGALPQVLSPVDSLGFFYTPPLSFPLVTASPLKGNSSFSFDSCLPLH